jgi:hypothetical protein
MKFKTQLAAESRVKDRRIAAEAAEFTHAS